MSEHGDRHTLASQPADPSGCRNVYHRSVYTNRQPMEKALWYLFAGSRGGVNRVRIVRRLRDQPQNANELAEQLDVDYNTITHHLDMLEDHDVVEPSDHDYGKLYFLTDKFERHVETFEQIAQEVN
jgi:DNA-binding transcriptional ArsR family regulator